MAQHIIFEFPVSDTEYRDRTSIDPGFVRVFWDDVLQDFGAVYIYYPPSQNPPSVLDANSDTTWKYRGPRNGEVSRYKFCDNGTLNYFELAWKGFPFVIHHQTPNAPACNLATVCDAYIQDPLLIISATSGGIDGQVTVRGYSTAIGLEYALTTTANPTPVWQAENTFTSLAPGEYTVHLRDSQGCEDEKTFTIAETPHYGVRFSTSYYDALGAKTKIDLLKRDYSGPVEEVTPGDSPLTIREGGEDLFSIIRGQEAAISLQASYSGQYLELFTSDDREFQVNVYKGEIESLFWRGWIVPDMYMEPYLAAPYNMSFSATDGLGSLKDIPFSEALPEGIISQFDILVFILQKTEISLNIISAVNIYETRMSKNEADDPLRQAYVSLDAYQKDKGGYTCAEVLEAILQPYGAMIRQQGAMWQITCIEDHKSNYIARTYTASGRYAGWQEINPAKLITPPATPYPNGFFWIKRSQTLELRPGFKRTDVHLAYDKRENLIRGGDFKATDFDAGWNHKFLDGTAYYSVDLVDEKAGNYAVRLLSTHLPFDAAFLQTERVWLASENLLGLMVSFEFMIQTGPTPVSPVDEDPSFLYSIKINDKYWQPSSSGFVNGEWDTPYFQFRHFTSSANSWQKVEVPAHYIPEDGWLTLRIYQPTYGRHSAVNLLVKNITAVPMQFIPPPLATEETFTALNNRKLFFVPGTVEARHGDVIPLENAPAMYRNVVLVHNNLPSLDWSRRGRNETTPLLQLLANSMLSFRKSPVRMLRGTLRGTYNLNQVLQEPDGTRYAPIGQEYDDRARTITGEFMELLGTGINPLAGLYLTETGDLYLTEAGFNYELENE